MPLPLRATTAALLTALCIASAPGAAHAEEKTFLAQAAEKWEQGDITDAAPLYEKALSQGGMFPPDVVLAHARIGTVLAATGKKEAALGVYKRLAEAGARATKPGGLLVFCSCSGAVRADDLVRALALGAESVGRSAVVLERHFQGADHPVPASFPEGLYLKSLIARIDPRR